MMDVSKLNGFLEQQMPAAMEWLRRMVEVNSFTANPDGVNKLGRLTAECFEPLGFTAEFVPSANPKWGNHLVMTRKGRKNRGLAFVSHLDTVFPPEEERANDFKWQPDGDRIFGPGTLDIKGGTVMMWLVLSALRAQAPGVFEDTGWQLFWNSSEECLSTDFEEVCRRRRAPSAMACLVFEAENRAGKTSLMVEARKGRTTWKVIVKGRGSHAGGNLKQGANALVQMARTIQQIDALTDFSKDLTFNVGTVSGGTVLNRVPHLAIAEGEFRALSPEICAKAKERLLGLAGAGEVRSVADGYACEVEVEITSESRPWPKNDATDRLLKVWTETASKIGLAVSGELRGGLSDGNSFWDQLPTLDGLGPWGDNDHCSERSPDGSKLPEFVQVSSFVPKACLNVLAISRLLEA
ncbi:MAG TPA: M20/M25/M40 family metallo-hydrolase [Verrucomicrobiae bacterium]|nr:M20/M25/M40 family metallo-hydrolase [Verrucomicrobiae bacterium]